MLHHGHEPSLGQFERVDLHRTRFDLLIQTEQVILLLLGKLAIRLHLESVHMRQDFLAHAVAIPRAKPVKKRLRRLPLHAANAMGIGKIHTHPPPIQHIRTRHGGLIESPHHNAVRPHVLSECLRFSQKTRNGLVHIGMAPVHEDLALAQ